MTDYNAMAVEIAAEFVKRYTASFVQGAARRVKTEVAKFKADQQEGIAKFYSHQLTRYYKDYHPYRQTSCSKQCVC